MFLNQTDLRTQDLKKTNHHSKMQLVIFFALLTLVFVFVSGFSVAFVLPLSHLSLHLFSLFQFSVDMRCVVSLDVHG